MIHDLLYHHLPQLYNIALNFLMFLNNYHSILFNYTLASQHLCIIYLSNVNITYAVIKWHTVFEYYSFISFIRSFCCIILENSLIVTVPLTNMYALLRSHKLDLNNEVLNLIWLLSLYARHNSSFFSIQVLVLNLDDLVCVLSNKFVSFVYWSIICY